MVAQRIKLDLMLEYTKERIDPIRSKTFNLPPYVSRTVGAPFDLAIVTVVEP